MTLKITYKEILLVIGVAVAMAIAVIFFYKDSVIRKSTLHTSSNTVTKSLIVDLWEKAVPSIRIGKLP